MNVEVISKEIIKSNPLLQPQTSFAITNSGRVKIHDHFVECNDEGIPYLEAQVTNYRLHDVLNNLVLDELNKFIPFALDEHIANEFSLDVQLYMFACRGFAIGLCISHKLADGLSICSCSPKLGLLLPVERPTKPK
ncbi:hypothetical protein L3X38_022852 [Prunus dulcis]|uniref:HXXXD-type acyl-transferase family protein n=1 Tax=Prunus dulcis TaxID=3755 RepID=A0AAD4Z5L1_PRUDU|nr:hypothetical protein L3X38_022852 [Prunus dulcis]